MKKLLLVIILISGLQSCNQSEIKSLENEIYYLESKNSDLEYQVSNLQDRSDELLDIIYQIESATSDLEWELNRLSSEVDDFGWEDWRTNVWDVENQLYNVKSSFYDLESSIYY